MNKTSTQKHPGQATSTCRHCSCDPTQALVVYDNMSTCAYQPGRLQLFQPVLFICTPLTCLIITATAFLSCTSLRLHTVAMHVRSQAPGHKGHHAAATIVARLCSSRLLLKHLCPDTLLPIDTRPLTHQLGAACTSCALHTCNFSLPLLTPNQPSPGSRQQLWQQILPEEYRNSQHGGGTPLSLPALRQCSHTNQVYIAA